MSSVLTLVVMKEVRKWEEDFHLFLDARHGEVLQRIRAEKQLSDEIEAELKAAIEEFKALQ